MRPVKQTRDFCVCLEGYTLPKYCLYGNISGVTYWHDPNHPDVLHVVVKRRNRKTGAITPHWTSGLMCDYPHISSYIRKFIASNDYVNLPVEFCTHKTASKEAQYNIATAIETRRVAKQERSTRKMLADAGAPTDRKIGDYMFKTTAWALDSKAGRIDGYCSFRSGNTAPETEKQRVDHLKVDMCKIARTEKMDKVKTVTLRRELSAREVGIRTNGRLVQPVEIKTFVRVERNGDRKPFKHVMNVMNVNNE